MGFIKQNLKISPRFQYEYILHYSFGKYLKSLKQCVCMRVCVGVWVCVVLVVEGRFIHAKHCVRYRVLEIEQDTI